MGYWGMQTVLVENELNKDRTATRNDRQNITRSSTMAIEEEKEEEEEGEANDWLKQDAEESSEEEPDDDDIGESKSEDQDDKQDDDDDDDDDDDNYGHIHQYGRKKGNKAAPKSDEGRSPDEAKTRPLQDHCNGTASSISKLVVRGERHSGTKLVQGILQKNRSPRNCIDSNCAYEVPLDDSQHGWKHGEFMIDRRKG